MNRSLFLLPFLVLSPTMAADDLGELLFQDDFERNETQESKEELGNGWGSNSKTRAQGNKQVDLRDGAMHIFIHATADHAVSVTHSAEFTDGAISLRFMLQNEEDSLVLNFADLEFKEVHAGHLFAAAISPKAVKLQDLKTGNMRLDIREARLAKKELTPEQQQALKGKDKSMPAKVETGKWHDLLVRVSGDELSVTLDGKPAGSFKSPGIAHPTKRTLRLGVDHKAVVDDVKIYRKK